MSRTSGSLRPANSDQTTYGDARYGFVTTVLDERYAQADRARMAPSGGPTLRERLGGWIVSLGHAIGGRALLPPSVETHPGTAIAPAARPGTAGGC